MAQYSDAYVALVEQGPFPGLIDPWAEHGRYFQQIHAGMIGYMLAQIQKPLLKMGYRAGREASLQIAESMQPDMFVYRASSQPDQKPSGEWDYAAAAEALRAEPGLSVTGDTEDFHGIYIYERETTRLVTVVEVIPPSNKLSMDRIMAYRSRRESIVQGKAVNVVEIDPTRSIQRMLRDKLVQTYAYHAAVYLPEQLPRLIGMPYGEPLKRIALPLRDEVIAVDLQPAYDNAYHDTSIAASLRDEGQYALDSLPFPSTLTDSQRDQALEAVATWHAELKRLYTS